jgi:hypothetical protein
MHRAADRFNQRFLDVMVLAPQPMQPGVEHAHESAVPGLFSLHMHSRPWLSAERWLSKAKKKPGAAATPGFLKW